MINNQQKALFHVAKTQVGMSDDEARALLGSFNVSSLTQLTTAKFDKVLRHFEGLGFKSICAKNPKTSKTRLLSKIHAIINDMDLSENYVNGMSKKMFKIERYKWCSASQLHKITAALSYHQNKKQAKI